MLSMRIFYNVPRQYGPRGIGVQCLLLVGLQIIDLLRIHYHGQIYQSASMRPSRSWFDAVTMAPATLCSASLVADSTFIPW